MPKLLDVPKYTKDGHYRIDVPFTSLDHTIARFEQEYGLQINPDFQRGHVWDQKKQTAFVEHMLKGGKGSEELRFNCVNWMRDPKPPMVLVDGLQRLTAVQLFMNNRLPVFGYTLHEYEDHKIATRGIQHTLSFRINDLPTREDVLKWYLEINSGGVIHTDAELNRVRELLRKEQEK